MKKFYNYVVYPNPQYFTLENPFSSALAGSIKEAYAWAEILMNCNIGSTSVNFRSENGWKLYYIIRKNGKLVQGKLD